VTVNLEAAQALLDRGEPFINSWQGHRKEHALEVQLPFLQMTWPGAPIVPVIMGDQRAEFCESLGIALAEVLKERRALIIASSDLSHYHTHQEAMELDRRVVESVQKLAPERLLDDLEQGRAEACGGGPIVAAMIAARQLGATSGDILDYRDSSHVSGDEERVVGYLAAAFHKSRG
jgi:AmmeMemoRadiSam system protein B